MCNVKTKQKKETKEINKIHVRAWLRWDTRTQFKLILESSKWEMYSCTVNKNVCKKTEQIKKGEW